MAVSRSSATLFRLPDGHASGAPIFLQAYFADGQATSQNRERIYSEVGSGVGWIESRAASTMYALFLSATQLCITAGAWPCRGNTTGGRDTAAAVEREMIVQCRSHINTASECYISVEPMRAETLVRVERERAGEWSCKLKTLLFLLSLSISLSLSHVLLLSLSFSLFLP